MRGKSVSLFIDLRSERDKMFAQEAKERAVFQNKISLVVCFTALVSFVPCLAAAQASTEAVFLPDFDYALSLGYVHAMGGIESFWTDGGECELSVGYRFSPFLGIEADGLFGFTGIQSSMANTVPMVDSYGNESLETSSGGVCMGLLLGPRFSVRIMKASVVSFSAGGLYFATQETGIDAEDCYSRWTSASSTARARCSGALSSAISTRAPT
jgi:hypothetical protein